MENLRNTSELHTTFLWIKFSRPLTFFSTLLPVFALHWEPRYAYVSWNLDPPLQSLSSQKSFQPNDLLGPMLAFGQAGKIIR
jgi:hypothetical protein